LCENKSCAPIIRIPIRSRWYSSADRNVEYYNNSFSYRPQSNVILLLHSILYYTVSVLFTRIEDVIFRNKSFVNTSAAAARRRKIVQSETYWIDVLCVVYVKRTKSTTIDKKGEKPFAPENFSAPPNPPRVTITIYYVKPYTYDKNNIIITVRVRV